MKTYRGGRRVMRGVLIGVLVLAVAVLIGVAIVLVPILTHQSAGGSGNVVPDDIVSEASAEGADDRTRVLSVETTAGVPADLATLSPGDELVVRGSGFDSRIGMYVSICKVPDVAGEKPGPCLGGLPEGAMEGEAAGAESAASSAWITDDWAWRAFATKGFDNPRTGSFEVRLLVANPTQEGLDCTTERCAVTTRADHTASQDRVQDMQLPVRFAD